MELTIQQKKALAMAAARRRRSAGGARPEGPAAGMPAQGYQGNMLRAASEGAQSGLFMGWDDELAGAMLAPIEATKDWFQGKGFDLKRGYERIQQAEDAKKQARREAFPKTSLAGEVLGSVATGGSIAKNVGSIAGRGLLPAAAEGAGYGAVYGAGEAKPGERLAGAGTGAAFGALAGAGTKTIGDQVIKRLPQNRAPAATAAPSIDDLGDEASALYKSARATGVTIKPQAFDKMAVGLRNTAGRVNTGLRPGTASILDEIDNMKGRPIDLEEFDELRQSIGDAIQGAKRRDVFRLQMMKDQLDNFADNLTPAEVTGNIKGFEIIKQAREVYSRKAKSEVIAKLLKDAELDTSQYTQSGAANTITKQFRKLAKNEKALKGFTAEERMLINELAMGGRSSKAMRFLAKFAPRGVVSTILGMGPAAFAGPQALAVPLIGHMAGKSVDKAALAGAQGLQGAVARGSVPQVPLLTGSVRPFIGPAGSIAGQQSTARR